MSKQEEASAQEQLQKIFDLQVSRVRSGESPGVILITFGANGQTLMTGDVATCHLALGVAQQLLQQDCIGRARGEGAATALFATPTAGNA